jgi:hypothetical protein
VLKKVYSKKLQCKTEPGITIDGLNNQLRDNYKLYVPYVLPELADEGGPI